MASADIINPQTFNRYVYVGNNPLNETDPTGEIWGSKDGAVQWFDTEDAMKAAGFAAYTLLYAFRAGTNQMVALNATSNVAINVASAAEWLSQQVSWGATAEMLAPGAAALAGVPVAVAALALGDALDPAGRWRTGLNMPEPAREWAGTKPSYWNEFLDAVKGRNSQVIMNENTSEEAAKESTDNENNKVDTSVNQGGKDARKANPDRVASAKSKEQIAKEELAALKSKPNKTPADKKEIQRLENVIKKEQSRQKKSESHGRVGKRK
jgi:hypothetical protein